MTDRLTTTEPQQPDAGAAMDAPVPDAAETLSDQVFGKLLSAIVQGDIAPGSKISEPELARAYGISRGPLREALHRLEGQRLLVRVPHAGARVAELSQQQLCELYEIRESLEGMACRLAAERMTAQQIAELREVLEAHARDEAFQAGRGYYLQEGDYDFHYRIVQGSGNGMLIRLLCDELYQLARMYRIRYSATPNRPRQAYAEHHRILDAIAEGDGELAELLMRRHIRTSRRNIEARIAQQQAQMPETAARQDNPQTPAADVPAAAPTPAPLSKRQAARAQPRRAATRMEA